MVEGKQFVSRKSCKSLGFMMSSFGIFLLYSADFASAQLDLLQEGAAVSAPLQFDIENDDYEGVFVPLTEEDAQNLTKSLQMSSAVLLSKLAGSDQPVIVQDPGGLFVDIKLFDKLDDDVRRQFLNELEAASKHWQIELRAGQIAADWPYPDRPSGAGGPGIHDSCLALGCVAIVVSNPTAPTAELSMGGYQGLYIEKNELGNVIGPNTIDPLINFVENAPWILEAQKSTETPEVCVRGMFDDVIGGDCYIDDKSSIMRLITADSLDYESKLEGIWVPNYAIPTISEEILQNFALGAHVIPAVVEKLNALGSE